MYQPNQYPPYQNTPYNQYQQPQRYPQQGYSQPQSQFQPQSIPQYGGAPNFRQYANTTKADQDGDLYEQGRSEFVKKVYTLLAISLIVTTLVCLWATNSQSFKTAFCNIPAMTILSILLFIISMAAACCAQQMQKYGLIIFIAFVIVESLLVGILCAQTNPHTVLTSAGITALIVIGLTIYAWCTNSDLTGIGPYIYTLCMVLFLFGIVMIFWRNEKKVYLVYSALATLLFCLYLIFDTQLVIGRFQNSYSFDHAYMAALQLYTDIMQIFVQLMRIMGIMNKNN